jgi:hypothetical protein
MKIVAFVMLVLGLTKMSVEQACLPSIANYEPRFKQLFSDSGVSREKILQFANARTAYDGLIAIASLEKNPEQYVDLKCAAKVLSYNKSLESIPSFLKRLLKIQTYQEFH